MNTKDEFEKFYDELELKKLEQLTEEPLRSDCTGELEALRKRAAAKKELWNATIEIQQEYNRASIFTRFWWWLKDLF